jgi:NADPH:quinone reductase-like Zn-dependent oxidoreductase
MRAIVLHAHGGPDALVPAELPDPVPGPGQATVDVHAVALNRLDLWVRGGLPGLTLPLPHVLGSDIAGVVDRGRDRRRSRPGSAARSSSIRACPAGHVRAACRAGTTCARATASSARPPPAATASASSCPEQNLLAKPAGLDHDRGGRGPAHLPDRVADADVTRARVAPGQVVLIHAVGSGVGVAGLQIARLHGARVIALASSDAKLAAARALGAEATVRSDAPDWEKQVRALPFVGKRGVDVVFEHTGAATWEASLRLCRRGGTS